MACRSGGARRRERATRRCACAAGRRAADRGAAASAARSSPVLPQQLRAERRVRRRDRGRHRRRTAALLHDARRGEPDEVDEVSFERRRESGTRSMIELDERELGELEVELHFVRAVRGRDPIDRGRTEAAESVDAAPEPEVARRRRRATRAASADIESVTSSDAAADASPGCRNDEATSDEDRRTSRSRTARPGLRSRPRMRRSQRKRMKRRSTGWTIG